MKFLSFFICFLSFLLFPVVALAAQAQLSFQTQYQELQVGEEGKGEIQLATNGEEIIGVDLALRYDAEALEIVKVTSTNTFSQEKIDVADGIISAHLFNEFEQAFSGNEDILTIHFKAKTVASPTAITFDFIDSKSQDTNVVNVQGKDVLGKVNALTIQIKEKTAIAESSTAPEIPAVTSGLSQAVNTSAGENLPAQNTANVLQNISVTPQLLYLSALVGVLVLSGGVYMLVNKN